MDTYDREHIRLLIESVERKLGDIEKLLKLVVDKLYEEHGEASH